MTNLNGLLNCNNTDLGFQGDYHARILVFDVPRKEVQDVLDGETNAFDLCNAPNYTTEHPLICMLGRQRNVRPFAPALSEFALAADAFGLSVGMSYTEAILAIPYVQLRNPKPGAKKGPFVFMPQLFLDNWFAVLSGWGYLYRKKLARFNVSAFKYELEASANERFSSTFKPHGTFKPARDFPHFAEVQEMCDLQHVGFLRGLQVCSYIRFDWDSATIRSIQQAEGTLSKQFCGALPSPFSFGGIHARPRGGLYLKASWELSPPCAC